MAKNKRHEIDLEDLLKWKQTERLTYASSKREARCLFLD